MDLNTLTAISPIDGRYRNKAIELAHYFSEYGLIRYRVLVEVEYFIALCELPLPQLSNFDQALFPALRKIYEEFTIENAQQIKEIEKTTNHDIKAVEYFIKQQFEALDIAQYQEFVHFGLTSQDINNTSIPLLLKDAIEEVIVPAWAQLRDRIEELAKNWERVSMLARTHGQPASPTRLGKELMVFVNRLDHQLNLLNTLNHAAKFGGATGNFNAHQVAYPDTQWVDFANKFVGSLGLERSQVTTQIEHYDYMAAWMDNFKRLNTILIDFNRDVWQYISMNYFTQKIKAGEVGSSAMPHKVNPIDFENSEGNLGIANAIFTHLSEKLPISRLQRDLTDSTVLRNLGTPLGHTVIALKATLKGLSKLQLNKTVIDQDLEANWAVVAEAIQTILRREGYPKPYEALKTLTRTNEKITSHSIKIFVEQLDVSDNVKSELSQITPFNYTGV
ncbi:adenylosuccinate lyase [Microscilla marina]|uniref:Adenylosuccinate lyase n=1 Tax=Microscilla marina ATCC 23134 TaxID=313606 RepID=A1ZFA5_MICM2|nr:adenylosuccinate lyase [Microscilla marina]EAY31207.1 adenylosuccinate lyase [Microscilla marina ATCC 23134]